MCVCVSVINVYFFDKVFASFWHLTLKNLHKKQKCTSIDTHDLEIWHVVWLVKKKTTCQLAHSKLKWHVLLGMWHWGDILNENVDRQLTITFVFEKVKWHFGFGVERQMKLVKHTHSAGDMSRRGWIGSRSEGLPIWGILGFRLTLSPTSRPG